MHEIISTNKDLWDIFTRKEEYTPVELDRCQRFRYYSSSQKDIMKPEVSEFLINNGIRFEYPNGKKFAVCLTHDIDEAYLSILSIGHLLYAEKIELNQSMKFILSRLKKKSNPLWNFTEIMDLEEKYGAKSSFFFLALKKGDPEFTYKVTELKDELGNIIDKGWEVGLHGGVETYSNLNEIKIEKERLENVIGKKVFGYRNHYLKFKVPDTWELLKEAGFKYDTTLAYIDCVGFRNGMCHPFQPYNINTNKYINILEISPNILDCSLDEYMQLDIGNAWKIIKRLIDTVEKYQGVITVLWHNKYMVFNEWLDLYKKILAYCHQKNAWMTSGEEIWKNAINGNIYE